MILNSLSPNDSLCLEIKLRLDVVAFAASHHQVNVFFPRRKRNGIYERLMASVVG